MWYTGIDPRTMKPVFVPKTPNDKALQRALMQWRKPQNRKLVLEALRKTCREDLIGYGKHCLVKPDRGGPPVGRDDPGAPSSRNRPARGKKNRADTRTRIEKKESPTRPAKKAGWAKAKKKR